MVFNSFSSENGFEVVSENQIKDLFNIDSKDVSTCFIQVDESMPLAQFEQIVKKFKDINTIAILKYKNFDFLMLCYKYSLLSVFEGALSSSELENTKIKISLQSHSTDGELPTIDVVKLFSSPVKIKTNIELYDRLSDYFKGFNSVTSFSLLELEGGGDIFIGEHSSPDLVKIANGFQFPHQYIGNEEIVEFDGKNNVFTSVLNLNNQKVWLIVVIDLAEKDYVLNNLFYKFLENALIYRSNKEKEKKLTVLATTDDVTGLFNQRKLSQDLAEAVEYHERVHEKFSLMFIDVDHFKSVNDNYGHVVGSKLLIDIGDVLTLILRSSDHIYRYGGDEFVVIMPTVDIATVHEIAGRVLTKIKGNDFDIGNNEIYNLSVSIGIAEYPTNAKSDKEIIQFADEMMYISKRSGRGKVFHVGEVDDVDVDIK